MKYCPVCDTQFEDSLDDCPKDGARLIYLQPKVDPLIGAVLKGRYLIVSKIGEGGMGAVYLAVQQPLGRQVAIKLLHANNHNDPALIKRFYREAQALSSLSHPNIVSIIDFGNNDDGSIFLVMEYLEGHELDYYTGNNKLSNQDLDSVISQACAGLSAAHQQGLIHRDIKPANIFICENSGQKLVKILDFGIVKDDQNSGHTNLTQQGSVVGTPGYIAPEQIKGETQPDNRADIYAMGAVLYFMMQGVRPYDGPSTQSIIFKQLTESPTPVDFETQGYPSAMRNIVLKAMAMNPEERYQSVTDLAQDVHYVLSGRSKFNWGKFFITAIISLVIALICAFGLQRFIAYRYATIANKEAIVFAMSNALSGHDREMGRSVKRGLEVAVMAYNASGGFHERPVELILKNDRYDPETAVANTKGFIDSGVIAIVGSGGSAGIKAVLPLVNETKTPFIAPICGADYLEPSPPLPYVFSLRAGYYEQVARIYQTFTKKYGLGLSEIAFYAQDNVYGQAVVNSAKRFLKDQGVESEPIIIWHQGNNVDASSALETIKNNANIKAIITASIERSVALLIIAIRQAGLAYPVASAGSLSNTLLYQELSASGLTNYGDIFNALTIPPLDADLPILRRFWEDFIRFAPYEQPNELMLEGYLAMQLALRPLATLPKDFTKEDYRNAMESLNKVNLGMGDICTITPTDHRCMNHVWLLQLDDKNYDKGNWHVIP